MASRNDVAIAWAWISILGRRPVGSAAATQPPVEDRPEKKKDDPEGFEEDFHIVSRTWVGPTQ